jgi:hypothetical protein
VTITPGPLLETASFEHRGLIRALYAYRIYFTNYDFTLAEHTEWRWADFEEIAELDFAGSDRKLLPALKRYFN